MLSVGAEGYGLSHISVLRRRKASANWRKVSEGGCPDEPWGSDEDDGGNGIAFCL